jgi:hypothetical protein
VEKEMELRIEFLSCPGGSALKGMNHPLIDFKKIFPGNVTFRSQIRFVCSYIIQEGLKIT